jgi:hypothetical protein
VASPDAFDRSVGNGRQSTAAERWFPLAAPIVASSANRVSPGFGEGHHAGLPKLVAPLRARDQQLGLADSVEQVA